MALTSISIAGSQASIVGSSQTFLPIMSSLNLALGTLGTLQETVSQGGQIQTEHIQEAYSSLLPVEGLLPRGELEEVWMLLPEMTPRQGAERLVRYLPALQQKFTEFTQGTPTPYSVSDVLTLRRITGQTPPLSGALAARFAEAPSQQRIPDWARELSMRCATDIEDISYDYPLILTERGTGVIGRDAAAGATMVLDYDFLSPAHFEVQFANTGRYWIRDLRSEMGTSVNGRLLEPKKWYLLQDESQISFSAGEGLHEDSFVISLPKAPPLEELRPEIEKAVSLGELVRLLRSIHEDQAADTVDIVMTNGVGISQVPETAGLARRVREILLATELATLGRGFEKISEKYMRGLPLEITYPMFRRTLESIQAAKTADELLKALVHSPVAGLLPASQAVARYLSGDARAYPQIPEDFGLRDKAKEVALRALFGAEDAKTLNNLGLNPADLVDRTWDKVSVGRVLKQSFTGMRKPGKTTLSRDELKAQLEQYVVNPVILRGPPPMPGRRGPHVVASSQWRNMGELRPARPFEGRICLALNRRSSNKMWDYFKDDFWPEASKEGIEFQMIMAPDSEQSRDGDEKMAYLYFHAADQEKIHQLVSKLATTNPNLLSTREGIFKIQLADSQGKPLRGVALTQEPTDTEIGFSALRSTALLRGIALIELLLARGEKVDWNQSYRIFAFFLERAGVDLANPALSRGGSQLFAPLLKFAA